MTQPGVKRSGILDGARGHGAGLAAGAYLFVLVLLVALAWLLRPELGLLRSAEHWLLAVGGLTLAAGLAWLLPSRPRTVETAGRVADTGDVAGHAGGGSASLEATAPEASVPPLSDAAQASIAVLPLESLSGAAEDALIAQGFSAEIVRALSGVPDLRIVPFLQSASYAGRTVNDIAGELRVRYVLSGSLQRVGGRIRVIATLTDASTGRQAWSESYERAIDDLFQVQRELAEAIAIETGSRYLNIVSGDLCRQPPEGLSAWSLTHKALTFWTVSYTPEASVDAMDWLRQALALEPDNAMAHALLGFVLNQRVVNSFAEDPLEENRTALAEIETALRLAPRDATIMEYAALVWLNCGSRRKALQTARRVVAIAPFNMVAWGYLGCALGWGGSVAEREEGLAILHRLLKVAPNHPSVPFWHYFLSFGYTEGGDFQSARQHAEAVVNVHPGFCLGWVLLANAAGNLGDERAAREAIADAQAVNPRFDVDGFRRYLVAISREVGDSVERQTGGLVKAGLLAPIDEVHAA